MKILLSNTTFVEKIYKKKVLFFGDFLFLYRFSELLFRSRSRKWLKSRAPLSPSLLSELEASDFLLTKLPQS